jgi:hypothetical protein
MFLLSVGAEVPEIEVFAGTSHQQTPQFQVFSPTQLRLYYT